MSENGQVNIDLYASQAQILQDWLSFHYDPKMGEMRTKNWITVLPVGAGKSFLIAKFIVIAAGDERYHRQKDIIYSALTHAQIRGVIWEQLTQDFLAYYGEKNVKINIAERTIRIPNISKINRKKAGEQVESLPDYIYVRLKTIGEGLAWKGLNVGLWCCDEAADYPQDQCEEVMARVRPSQDGKKKEGQIIFTSVPNGDTYFKDMFHVRQAHPERFPFWGLHHYSYQTYGEPQHMIDWRLREKEGTSPMEFARNHECRWDAVQDRFFYEWNTNLYAQTCHDDGVSPCYSFHDWNVGNMVALLANLVVDERGVGRFEIFKEYSIRNASTYDMAQAIRTDYPLRKISAIIDISGKQLNRDTTSTFGTTDLTILRDYAITVINNNVAPPSVRDTDNSSNLFIRQGRLNVDPSCRLAIKALSSYHYKTPQRIGKELVKYTDPNYSYIDGMGDCIRTAIHFKFPVTISDFDPTNPHTRYITRAGFRYRAGRAMWQEDQAMNNYLEKNMSRIISKKDLLHKNRLYKNNISTMQSYENAYYGGLTFRSEVRPQAIFANETAEEWDAIVNKSSELPICRNVVRTLNDVIFSEPITRNFPGDDVRVDEILLNFDGNGVSADNFMQRASEIASIYGHCWVGVDSSKMGGLPYGLLITPTMVWDWDWDWIDNVPYLKYLKYVEKDDGKTTIIKLLTVSNGKVIWGRYKTLYADSFTTTYTPFEEGIIDYPLIPFILHYATRDTRSFEYGVSDIDIAYQVQKEIYALEVEKIDAARACQSLIVAKDDDNIRPVGLANRVYRVASVKDAFAVYPVSITNLALLIQAQDDLLNKLEELLGFGGLRSNVSVASSGVSRSIERETLYTRCAGKASLLEITETKLWNIVYDFLNKKFDGEIVYGVDYNKYLTRKSFELYQTLSNMAGGDAIVKSLVNQSIIRYLAGDDAEEYLALYAATLNEQQMDNSLAEGEAPPTNNKLNSGLASLITKEREETKQIAINLPSNIAETNIEAKTAYDGSGNVELREETQLYVEQAIALALMQP